MTANYEVDNEQLLDLLARWEQLQSHATEVDLAALCADCPHRLSELKDAVTRLRGVAALLVPITKEDFQPATLVFDASSTVAQTSEQARSRYQLLRSHARGG